MRDIGICPYVLSMYTTMSGCMIFYGPIVPEINYYYYLKRFHNNTFYVRGPTLTTGQSDTNDCKLVPVSSILRSVPSYV